MASDKYIDALHEAQQELAQLEERRKTLIKLIQNLKDLSADERYELTPPPGYVPKGLTEEIRTILTLTTTPMDAVEIRDALIMRGVEYSNSKNLLINVHTVLSRIANELDVIDRDSKKAYRIAGSGSDELRRRLYEGAAAVLAGVAPPLPGVANAVAGKVTPPPKFAGGKMIPPPPEPTERKKK